MYSYLTLVVLEAIAISEATIGDGIRSERPEVDRSGDVVVIIEEILIVLIGIVDDVYTPVDFLIAFRLQLLSLSTVRVDMFVQTADGEVGLRSRRTIVQSVALPVVVLSAPSRMLYSVSVGAVVSACGRQR